MKRLFFVVCILLMKNFCVFAGGTPSESLEKLREGNERYQQDHLLHPDISIQKRAAFHATQEPFAVVLGCSDSRVPPEIVFDQGVGDIFVVRVAGNVVGPIELDSLEYAVKYLHASLVVVLGHEQCGAMKAVLAGDVADIEAVAEQITPVIAKCEKECKKECVEKNVSLTDFCTKANVRHIVKKIKESPLIREYVQDKRVDVVAGFYNFTSGKVEILSVDE